MSMNNHYCPKQDRECEKDCGICYPKSEEFYTNLLDNAHNKVRKDSGYSMSKESRDKLSFSMKEFNRNNPREKKKYFCIICNNLTIGGKRKTCSEKREVWGIYRV